MGLEDLLKGTAIGFTRTFIDPFGASINHADSMLGSGAGDSDHAAYPTVNAAITRNIYDNPNKTLDFSSNYVPRYVGSVAGFGVGIGTYIGAYALGGPIAALAVPVITGAYGLLRATFRDIHDIVVGEKNQTPRKATLYQGFKSGWAAYTQGPLALFHSLENSLTGRGLRNSHINSSYRDAYHPMRRNLRASIGHVAGAFVGIAASVLTFGILPLYKSLRDAGRPYKTQESTRKTAPKRIVYRSPRSAPQYAHAGFA